MKPINTYLFFFYSIVFSLCSDSYAQVNLVPNPSFETGPGVPNCTYGPNNEAMADEFDNDIDNWRNTRKKTQSPCFTTCGGLSLAFCCTPSTDWYDVKNNTPSPCDAGVFEPPTPYMSDRMIHLFADPGNNEFEGVRTQLTQCLKGGWFYRLKMNIANPVGCTIKAHLTQQGVNWQNSSNNKKQMDVFVKSLPGTGSPAHWVINVSQDIYVEPQNDNALCNLIIMADNGRMLIDDVSLIELGPGPGACCPQSKFYEQTNSLPSLTQVRDFIKAGSDAGIPNISGPVTVKNGQTVTFKAGTSIELLPGFTAEAGSNFIATITECNVVTKTTGDPLTIIHFPNIISPNNDGQNDQFCLQVNGADECTITVFNKFGTKVHEQTAGNIATNFVCLWNGSCTQSFPSCISSGCVSDGVYQVVVQCKNCTNTFDQTGNIQVSNPTSCLQAPIISARSSNSDTSYTLSNNGGTNNNVVYYETAKISSNLLIPDSQFTLPKSSIIIHPNPTTGKFSLSVQINNGAQSQSSSVSIYNSTGAVVYQTNSSPQSETLNIDLGARIPRGLYLVKVQSGEEMSVQKLVLE